MDKLPVRLRNRQHDWTECLNSLEKKKKDCAIVSVFFLKLTKRKGINEYQMIPTFTKTLPVALTVQSIA